MKDSPQRAEWAGREPKGGRLDFACGREGARRGLVPGDPLLRTLQLPGLRSAGARRRSSGPSRSSRGGSRGLARLLRGRSRGSTARRLGLLFPFNTQSVPTTNPQWKGWKGGRRRQPHSTNLTTPKPKRAPLPVCYRLQRRSGALRAPKLPSSSRRAKSPISVIPLRGPLPLPRCLCDGGTR